MKDKLGVMPIVGLVCCSLVPYGVMFSGQYIVGSLLLVVFWVFLAKDSLAQELLKIPYVKFQVLAMPVFGTLSILSPIVLGKSGLALVVIWLLASLSLYMLTIRALIRRSVP